jgi:nuclear transport factor 2 (NTF2) superfamily protein
MHDRVLECSDESFGDSAEASGRCVRHGHGSVSGPATPPGGGFAAFMSMRLSRDDAVKDDAKSEERVGVGHAVLVRSFERAYVENDVQAMVALCREDADWCDGSRLVKGRGRIAEFLKREWGAQSHRVQRTRVFTSGQNRVAACFEREYVVPVPGDVPGVPGNGDEDLTGDDASADGFFDAERKSKRVRKFVARGAEFWDFDEAGFVRSRVGIVTQTPVKCGEAGIVGSSWSNE